MMEKVKHCAETGFVETPTSKIHFCIDGARNSDWIILSNSLGANLNMWNDQIPLLSSKFRVLRYDTRGHGGSSTPNGRYTFDDLCFDVMQLMDHFEIESTVFMGLSMGGMTGLGLGLQFPQRFSKIVCADGRADAPEVFRNMWDDRISKVHDGGLQAIVDGTIQSWFTSDWIERNPSHVAEIKNMVLSNDAEGYVGCCYALKELDYLKELPRLTVPVLYVGGDQDKGASPEVMSNMAEATPNATYVKIRDAAHVANINAPERFNAAIQNFLDI
ncbi:3-oxoadipate enol-lactonase [Rhodobacterales bacterium LSUCC0387]|nr:3-oxoadipate enol-lactonase [Rhodobacterales bacterium LSUCC0374]MBF9039767.1 3-oxoadipate enol-lactonase [Rhodobacterales bacterium LSUCC0387]